MKNWPGIPASSPPRSTRSSVYGPTGSAATTLRRSRLMLDPLLQRVRDLLARVRDRIDGEPCAGERRDARNAAGEGCLPDPRAVLPGARTLRGVDDEVALAGADRVDDGVALLDDRHVEPGCGEHCGGAGRREQVEAEVDQAGGDRADDRLVG